jgi:hypothetical protein
MTYQDSAPNDDDVLSPAQFAKNFRDPGFVIKPPDVDPDMNRYAAPPRPPRPGFAHQPPVVDDSGAIVPAAPQPFMQNSAADGNWDRFLSALSFLETGFRNVGSPLSSARGYLQDIAGTRDMIIRQGLGDPWAGGWQNQRDVNRRYISRDFPQAAQAISNGDFATAIRILAPRQWPSLPGGPQSHSQMMPEFYRILGGQLPQERYFGNPYPRSPSEFGRPDFILKTAQNTPGLGPPGWMPQPYEFTQLLQQTLMQMSQGGSSRVAPMALPLLQFYANYMLATQQGQEKLAAVRHQQVQEHLQELLGVSQQELTAEGDCLAANEDDEAGFRACLAKIPISVADIHNDVPLQSALNSPKGDVMKRVTALLKRRDDTTGTLGKIASQRGKTHGTGSDGTVPGWEPPDPSQGPTTPPKPPTQAQSPAQVPQPPPARPLQPGWTRPDGSPLQNGDTISLGGSQYKVQDGHAVPIAQAPAQAPAQPPAQPPTSAPAAAAGPAGAAAAAPAAAPAAPSSGQPPVAPAAPAQPAQPAPTTTQKQPRGAAVQPVPQVPALNTGAAANYQIPAGVNWQIDNVAQQYEAGDITIDEAKARIPGGEKGKYWPAFDSRVNQIEADLSAVSVMGLQGQAALDQTLRVAPDFGERLAGYITGATAPPGSWNASKRPYGKMIEIGQSIDPTFTQQVFGSRGQTMHAYATGKEAQTMVAYSTAVLHSASTRLLVAALPQGPQGRPALTSVKDYFIQHWGAQGNAGQIALAKFNESVAFLAPEAARAAMTGNKPFEADIKEFRKGLEATNNPGQINATLDIIDQRLAEKSAELRNQWIAATGKPLTDLVKLFDQNDPLGTFGYDPISKTTHAQRVQAIADSFGIGNMSAPSGR